MSHWYIIGVITEPGHTQIASATHLADEIASNIRVLAVVDGVIPEADERLELLENVGDELYKIMFEAAVEAR